MENTGERIRAAQDAMRTEIFEENGYTAEGKPKDIATTQEQLHIDPYQQMPMPDVAAAVKAYNDAHQQAWESIPPDKRVSTAPKKIRSLGFAPKIEADPKNTVFIGVDEIGVHKQKDQRKKPVKRCIRSAHKLTPHERYMRKKLNRKRQQSRMHKRVTFALRSPLSFAEKHPEVHTTVCTVRTPNGSISCVIGSSVKEALMNLVAMLLFSGLMPMHLVFFIDGASILKTLIEEYFGYCCYQIDMDWYHAKRNIANLIRQGAAGSKKEKEDAVRQALNCLWLYDLNGLKELIARLNKQPEANHDKLKTAMGYLQRKMPNLTCYSLRKELNRTLQTSGS